jgi:hypothetical protein
VDNRFEGEGRMVYVSGNVYEGHWCNDERSGSGVMHYKKKKCVYRGQWVRSFPRVVISCQCCVLIGGFHMSCECDEGVVVHTALDGGCDDAVCVV